MRAPIVIVVLSAGLAVGLLIFQTASAQDTREAEAYKLGAGPHKVQTIKEIGEIVKANADKREEAAKKVAAAQQKTLDEIVGLFTDDQKKTWQKLIGEPLKVEKAPRQVPEKPRDLNDPEEYARFLKKLTEEGKYDPKKFAEFEAKLLKSNAEGRWKEIKWQENMATAMKKAKAEKKPLFLYIVVGHKGEKSAAEC